MGAFAIKKYADVLQAIEDGKYNDYTDRVDVSIEISLLDYGIIRNPQSEDTIFCLTTDGEYMPNDTDNLKSIELKHISISKEQVIDELTESESGFFSYIGSDRATELNNLDNNNLTPIIFSLNQYSGNFND